MSIRKQVDVNDFLETEETSDWNHRQLEYEGKTVVVREIGLSYVDDRADVPGYLNGGSEINTVPEEDREELQELVADTSLYEIESEEVEFW